MAEIRSYDVFSKAKRSQVMSAIRGSGNRATELRMIALLRETGVKGWRRKASVFGKPDFVFPRERLAVFVDGCFWHRHKGCKFAYVPKSRQEFWLSKFDNNVARDNIVGDVLRRSGWKVLRIWECELTREQWSRIGRRIKRLRGVS